MVRSCRASRRETPWHRAWSSVNGRPRSSRRFMASSPPMRNTGTVTIGLICAIPQEFNALRAVLAHTHTERAAHTEFVTGTIDGHDVVLAGSGMGKVNASLVTTLLADRFGCRAIVFSGVAGGL